MVNSFENYEHAQAGTLMRILLGVLMLFFCSVATGLLIAGKEASAVIGTASPVGLLLVILALFHSLTVRVSAELIHLSFGIGLVSKSIAVREIESASIARTRWYNGWGIKKISGGWLFNISGFDTVELKLGNGRRYLIGTDEPERLYEVIESAMANV